MSNPALSGPSLYMQGSLTLALPQKNTLEGPRSPGPPSYQQSSRTPGHSHPACAGDAATSSEELHLCTLPQRDRDARPLESSTLLLILPRDHQKRPGKEGVSCPGPSQQGLRSPTWCWPRTLPMSPQGSRLSTALLPQGGPQTTGPGSTVPWTPLVWADPKHEASSLYGSPTKAGPCWVGAKGTGPRPGFKSSLHPFLAVAQDKRPDPHALGSVPSTQRRRCLSSLMFRELHT